MSVTVPAADVQGTILQNTVNSISALITANPSMVPSLNNALYTAQLNLCLYLLSQGSLVPATVLANETYTSQQSSLQ